MHKLTTHIIFPLLWGCLFTGCTTQLTQPEIVHFQTDIAEDATPAVLAKIMQASEMPIAEITFEKGTYHFHPEKGKEFYSFISNHNDVTIRTAFPLLNFENLIIDGQGSTFVFHGKMIPFLIEDCKNIKIRNVSIDWEVPFHSEGLVVANDLERRTFDVKFSDKYPYEIRNEQLIFIKPYYEHTIGQSILYDPKRNAIAYDTESYTPVSSFARDVIQHKVKTVDYKYGVDPRAPHQARIGRQNRLRAEQLEPGLVRIHNHRKKIPPVGMIFVCKGQSWINRLAPAFRITHTYGFQAENVHVYHAGGMGLIAENSADLTLDHFNVTPSQGRMVSTTADATHFVGCRGNITLKNCTFNNQLDDASNVHGTYQIVQDILDEYTIGARIGHFQQHGFRLGIPKDTIGLVRLDDSFFPYDKRTIKSITKINSRYQLITFNEKLPADLQKGDLLENLNAYPELLVENCNISRNRARGLLLSTPKKTVIKNNFFSTEMEALLIPVESGFWFESGSSTNLTITNNTFQDCNHSGHDRGIIRFETDDDNENIAFRNIEISDNIIHHFDNLILEITNTDNLLFKGNSITHSGTFPKLFPQNPAIKIEASQNVRFEGNMYEGDATEILEVDSLLEGLLFQ